MVVPPSSLLTRPTVDGERPGVVGRPVDLCVHPKADLSMPRDQPSG
jgi:hypothetical protein